jgi:hypothetical protein
MKTITLNQIKEKLGCRYWWVLEKILKSLNKTKADDEEITFRHLLNELGLKDTLLIIDECVKDKQIKRNMCADFMESVLHIWEDLAKSYGKEQHLETPQNLINALRNPKITNKKLEELYEETVWEAGNAAFWGVGLSADFACLLANLSCDDNSDLYAERRKQKEIILKYLG